MSTFFQVSVEGLSFESIFSPRKSLVTKRGPFVNFVWIIKAMLSIQLKTTNRIRTWLLHKPRIQLQVFFFPTSEIDFCFFNDLQDKNLSIFITALQELFEVCVSSLKVFLPFTALPTTSFELPNFFCARGDERCAHKQEITIFFCALDLRRRAQAHKLCAFPY